MVMRTPQQNCGKSKNQHFHVLSRHPPVSPTSRPCYQQTHLKLLGLHFLLPLGRVRRLLLLHVLILLCGKPVRNVACRNSCRRCARGAHASGRDSDCKGYSGNDSPTVTQRTNRISLNPGREGETTCCRKRVCMCEGESATRRCGGRKKGARFSCDNDMPLPLECN